MDLIADIGATNTRCALVDPKGTVVAVEKFKNAGFTDLVSLLQEYLQRRRSSDRPRSAAIGVAGPVLGDEVVMTNLGWSFSQAKLRDEFGLNRLIVVNDFGAIAHSLPYWKPEERVVIGGGKAMANAPMAAIGPGSGLGVATIVPGPEGWNVATGEGGHVTLAATDSVEVEIVTRIRKQFGHCSAERLISGPGLVLLYETLSQIAGREPPKDLTPARVTELAGEADAIATKTLAAFFRFLGTVAGDLALTTGARGGVFIAGGIVPRLLDELRDSDFRTRFESKGRYQGYLKSIPTEVLVDPLPAFRGLTRLLGYRS